MPVFGEHVVLHHQRLVESHVLLSRRCRAESVRGDTAIVFFLDYGNRGLVRLVAVRQVPPALLTDLASIPALAMECSLAGIQPNQARSQHSLK